MLQAIKTIIAAIPVVAAAPFRVVVTINTTIATAFSTWVLITKVYAAVTHIVPACHPAPPIRNVRQGTLALPTQAVLAPVESVFLSVLRRANSPPMGQVEPQL